MERIVLEAARIHPVAQAKIAKNHRDIIEQCQQAVARSAVVVIGMSQNTNPKRARKALDKKGIRYEYLEFGSYFGLWRRRNALKMWTGWPTFPMVFLKGTLIGGADDLEKLIASGELDRMLAP